MISRKRFKHSKNVLPKLAEMAAVFERIRAAVLQKHGAKFKESLQNLCKAAASVPIISKWTTGSAMFSSSASWYLDRAAGVGCRASVVTTDAPRKPHGT